MTPAGGCRGRITYDLAERHDGMMIQCPVCTCWQRWLADQERFVPDVPSEPPDIYGVHGR